MSMCSELGHECVYSRALVLVVLSLWVQLSGIYLDLSI
jgi:hypothetical protein